MRLTCPICGERDRREFYYQGEAVMLERPAPDAGEAAWDDYLHLRDTYGLGDFSGCLFIDDSVRNVAAARKLGLDAIRFEGPDLLPGVLAERGIFIH